MSPNLPTTDSFKVFIYSTYRVIYLMMTLSHSQQFIKNIVKNKVIFPPAARSIILMAKQPLPSQYLVEEPGLLLEGYKSRDSLISQVEGCSKGLGLPLRRCASKVPSDSTLKGEDPKHAHLCINW